MTRTAAAGATETEDERPISISRTFILTTPSDPDMPQTFEPSLPTADAISR